MCVIIVCPRIASVVSGALKQISLEDSATPRIWANAARNANGSMADALRHLLACGLATGVDWHYASGVLLLARTDAIAGVLPVTRTSMDRLLELLKQGSMP